MATKINPELLGQMEKAGGSPVQAIVQLRAAHQPGVIPSPDDTTQLAKAVLHRVATDVGHPATRSNVLGNLATLIVEADSDFLRALMKQPEVISAIPNKTAESPFIPPHGKRPE